MSNSKYSLDDLTYLMSRLRDPSDGCPWDLAQSYESIVPSTIEEAYEVADTIETGNYVELKEELGDLLFQTVFYSQLASEEARFNFAEVISDLVAKLVRRHPHVFPDGRLSSRIGDRNKVSLEVKKQWEDIKAKERKEKGQASLMDDVPKGFPALLRAQKLQKRAARIGFDWPEHHGVFDKLEEEIEEVKQAICEQNLHNLEEELGDLLFTCVNLVRRLGFDSESSLRKASSKFEQRFRYMERQVDTQGLSKTEISKTEINKAEINSETEQALLISREQILKSLSADELESLWSQAKENEDKETMKERKD